MSETVYYCPENNKILHWVRSLNRLYCDVDLFYIKDQIDINVLVKNRVLINLGKL